MNITLNPQNNGWYFIQIIRDTTIVDTGNVKIKFDDTTRLIAVRINHIEKTILSPFDRAGNSLSNRLKFLGTKEIGNGRSFFEFYNPTDEELRDIDQWGGPHNRSYKIRLDADTQFRKYFNEGKP